MQQLSNIATFTYVVIEAVKRFNYECLANVQ